MNCKSCKHWQRSHAWGNNPLHYGTCKSGFFVDHEKREVPINGVASWDYESYGSGIHTGENFGCIHFETTKGGE